MMKPAEVQLADEQAAAEQDAFEKKLDRLMRQGELCDNSCCRRHSIYI